MQTPGRDEGDRSAWVLVIAGLLAIASTIAVFSFLSTRQDHLLDSGLQREAQVVEVIPDASWNMFDLGRIVVRYEINGQSFRRQIWLDDYTHLGEGDSVTVFVDPDDPERVRTKTDQNTPNGMGMWFLLLGLAGLTTLVVGSYRLVLARLDRRLARSIRGGSVDTPRAMEFQGSTAQTAAWDEPAVRTSWKAHLRRARDQAVIGGAVVAVMTAVWINVDKKDDEFARRGIEATATVTGGGYGGRSTSDWIDVAFDVDGKTYEVSVNDELPDDHPEGSTFEILYDPEDPSHVRTRSNPNHSNLTEFLLFMPSLVGGGLFVVGVLAGVATYRWRRWLRSHSTLPVHVTEGALSRWFVGDAWLLRIETPSNLDVVTRLTGTRRWFDSGPEWFAGAPGEFEGPAVVCAGQGRRLLVFDPDVEIPVEVTLPRTLRSAKKWLDSF